MKDIYITTEQRLRLLDALLQQFGLNASEISEFNQHVDDIFSNKQEELKQRLSKTPSIKHNGSGNWYWIYNIYIRFYPS